MHNRCVRWLKDYSGKLYSTEEVLTEILYILNFSVKAQTTAIDFVLKSVVELIPAFGESLKKVRALMRNYSDLPMDYADATIICLSRDIGIKNILTLDKKNSAFTESRINRLSSCLKGKERVTHSRCSRISMKRRPDYWSPFWEMIFISIPAPIWLEHQPPYNNYDLPDKWQAIRD